MALSKLSLPSSAGLAASIAPSPGSVEKLPPGFSLADRARRESIRDKEKKPPNLIATEDLASEQERLEQGADTLIDQAIKLLPLTLGGK